MGIAAPLIILLFYEWYRFRRRKVILQKQKGKKPPFTWPLRVEASAPKLFESDHFYGAARLMRRRQADEFYQLDIDGTIAATVESLGYPSFRYKVASKPPEYLFLIDRSSFRDHQALFFNELTKSLEREGVFVARYFYDGDPRICCQDGGEGCVHLVDLQNKFAGHRLLLIGNGEKLIDPVTGRVQPWARTFSAWQNRAVLTPEDVTRWGLSESSLAGQFVVRPATSQGLRASIESFEATLRSGPYRRIKGVVEPPQFEDLSITETVASLRTYLGEEIFQWVCACAIYPELQWDLTLYLGSLPCLGQGLIREDNLLKLVRLPWFRAGTMPDELRWHLIRELDREKERAIRIALIELLEKNPPPKETFAANSYELNLVVQRWLSFRDRQRRREMIQALNAGPRSQILQDYTVMRFLESAPESSLSMILPRKFRKVFFQNGIPAFGVKTGFRILLTLAVAATAWFVMRPGQGQSDANPLQQRTTSNTSRTTSNTNSALTDLTLVVRDDFSSEKWASDNNENKYEDGEYHMHASTGNYIVVLGPDLNDYYTKDRTMRVRARSVDGTASSYGYGLVVHGTLKSGENRAAVGYAFLVYTGNDPSYAVYHLTGDQDRTLVKWTNSSVVLSGTNTNQLEVRIKGDQISYYVNGQYMTSITDSAGYGDGRVGFYTSNDNPVAFDDLEIYK
ncbi:MAG TPA: hypothetical protein VM911_22335 [Pyrinomonadaceae bacterium]|nr:hypothetical protein [Pyrinomonadaceae bacterium]